MLLEQIKITFKKLKLYSFAPHSMLIKVYNHVHNSIKCENEDKAFERQLKSFLFELL